MKSMCLAKQMTVAYATERLKSVIPATFTFHLRLPMRTPESMDQSALSKANYATFERKNPSVLGESQNVKTFSTDDANDLVAAIHFKSFTCRTPQKKQHDKFIKIARRSSRKIGEKTWKFAHKTENKIFFSDML